MYGLTLSPINGIISSKEKQMESIFVPEGPIYLQIIVHKCDILSRSFTRIVQCYSVNRLQLGLLNDFIDPIGLRCLTTLNVMH